MANGDAARPAVVKVAPRVTMAKVRKLLSLDVEVAEALAASGNASARVEELVRESGHVAIYVLVDPTDDTVRYVGQTKRIDSRLAEHIKQPSNIWLSEWIAALLEQGLLPSLRVVEMALPAEADATESVWIDRLKVSCQLLNVIADGGGCMPNTSGRRPRTEDGTVATRSLRVRVTKEELDGLRSAAKAAGLTVSDFVRSVCLSD